MEHMARLALVEQSLGDSEKFKQVLYELFRLINFILDNPHDYELRTIKSETLNTNLKLEEFKDYLKYVGFIQQNNQVTYPKEQTLSGLRMAQAAIERKIGFCCGSLDRNQVIVKSKHGAVKPKTYILTPSNILTTKNKFLLEIESLFNNMIKYEDEELLELARQHIPIVKMQLMAIDRVREQQRQIKAGETEGPDLPFDIAMLMELLAWFKHEFFSWVDQPECDQCGGKTKFYATSFAKVEDEHCKVEMYKCQSCGSAVRFPRHNAPRTLLRARRGRCGEWANCFTLLCRALGYDTRYVFDATDHVWCEVFDYDTKKWLHVDPCEAKINTPLMYSHGWGKKLSYVIAFSRDDLQDVTWRYCGSHKEALRRRNACSEEDLIATILRLREYRQRQVSEPRRRYLAKRCLEELVQLMEERTPSDYESEGRLSGSVEWRSGRGELGSATGHSFTFTSPGDVVIEYFPTMDSYLVQGVVSGPCALQSWAAGAYSSSNVQLKEERDWNMVYLARKEGTAEAQVSWRLTSADSCQFSKLKVDATAAEFHGASVLWTVTLDDELDLGRSNGELHLSKERNFKTAVITARLSGGQGTEAWQHTQLFRAPTDSKAAGLRILATLVPNVPSS